MKNIKSFENHSADDFASAEKFYIFEEGEENNYKKYTFPELMNFFKPEGEEELQEVLKDEIISYNQIKTVNDLIFHIDNYINNNAGVHYRDFYIDIAD